MTFTIVNPEKKDAAVRRLIKFMIETESKHKLQNKKEERN